MPTAPVDPLSSLYDPVVRDLAWALSSPPLLVPRDDFDWPPASAYQALCETYAEHLRALDSEPSALHEAVLASRSGRLGQYFEALWRFWLRTNPDYALCAHNLPIRVAGETLGELDLLVQDRHTGLRQHWELAVKFYLGIGDTHDTSAWLGPNVQDRLDRKLQRLRTHQLPLLRHPATQEILMRNGWYISRQRVILKGRLFYPLSRTADAPDTAATDHLRGWWARATEFHARFADEALRWRPLTRQDWLAPVHRAQAAEPFTTAQVVQRLGSASRPVCVAGFLEADECTRGFIVPLSWPEKAN